MKKWKFVQRGRELTAEEVERILDSVFDQVETQHTVDQKLAKIKEAQNEKAQNFGGR